MLRVRYADANETWLYLDPERGGIVQRSGNVSRLRRWLYQGFHSLDFPFLYFKRPLWDIVVIVLSIGGTVLSFTTMLPAIQAAAPPWADRDGVAAVEKIRCAARHCRTSELNERRPDRGGILQWPASRTGARRASS